MRRQPTTQYDYTNQAWLVDGLYVPCAHPAAMNCKCYGKLHAGQPVDVNAEVH